MHETNKSERRTFNATLRVAPGPNGKISGHALMFNVLSEDLGGFREKVSPDAVTETIETADIRALFNHDPNFVLGRSSAKTLKMKIDRLGLKVDIDPPNTQWAKDLRESIRRGDISQMSFGFNTINDSWQEVDGQPIRTLEEISLIDVSVVVFPAYPQTDVSARHAITNTYGGSMNIEQLHETRNGVVEEMRQCTNDAEKYDRLSAEYDRLGREIRNQEIERDLQKVRVTEAFKPVPDGGEIRDDRKASHSAIVKPGEVRKWGPGEFRADAYPQASETEQRDLAAFFNGGLVGLTDEQRARFSQRALQMDVDTSGGFLIAPEQFGAGVIEKLTDMVVVRQHATIVTCKSGQSLGIPALDHDPGDYSLDWTGEILTGSEDSTMDFDKRLLSPKYLARRIKVSNTLINRGGSYVMDLVKRRLAYVFGVVEDYNFLQGDGTNKPLGLLVASAAGISTGRDTTAASSTTVTSDELYDLIFSVKAQYRQNARFIMGRDTLKEIMQLKTGEGDYIWKPGIKAGVPSSLMGYPVHESEYVPAFSSGNYVMIFGDFSFYYICDALDFQIQVLNELYAATNQTGIIARREVDAAPVVEEAFARLALA